MTQVLHNSIKTVGQSFECIRLEVDSQWNLLCCRSMCPRTCICLLQTSGLIRLFCYNPYKPCIFYGKCLENNFWKSFFICTVVNGNSCTWFLVAISVVQHQFCCGIKLASSFIEVTADWGVKPLNSLNHPSLSLHLFSISVSLSVFLSVSSLSFTPPLQSSSLQCHLSH